MTEKIVEAAKKASVHEFIESLPNGYDTVLVELGDSLSGGEKHRISTMAIADYVENYSVTGIE